jgi:hypothetical protein
MMLPLLANCAVAAFAGAMALTLLDLATPVAAAHLVFAVGILPLMLGAILHFVPVLTRSGPPPLPVQIVPLLALAAGALMTAGFASAELYAAALHGAPLLALAAALVMAGWIVGRGRSAIGAPHPGLRWYLAAVLCLAAALAVIVVMPMLPTERAALRLFHLHLNTLGFIGLTALGTLQVLLPTVARRPDPAAAARLRSDLWFAVGGAGLIAGGAAWAHTLSLAGLALLLVPLLRLVAAWATRFRAEIGRHDSPASALAFALLGLVAVVLLGAGHGRGWLSGRDAIAGFVVAFLLPLVTGALSQLVPVWLKPGVQTAWHNRARRTLAAGSAARGALFVIGGISACLGWRAGLWLAVAALATFLPGLVRVLAAARTGNS